MPFARAINISRFDITHITDLISMSVERATGSTVRKSIPLFIDPLNQLDRLSRLNFAVFGGDQIHYGAHDKESLDVFKEMVSKNL
jgi:hypothetical protein